MNKTGMKTTAILLIAIFMISAFVIAIPVIAQATPTIDGTISSGEWDSATVFTLFPISGSGTYTAYMMNDDQFVYVAFDYAITTGSDFAAFNTYKEGTFTPETINAPCVSSWGPVWDTIVDENDDGIPETWHREDPTTRYEYDVDTATEMKVPLAELGLEAGDAIKTMFVLNAPGIGTYISPEGAGSFDLNTYADFTLWELPEPKFTPKGTRQGWVHWVWIEYEWHSEEWSDFVTWTVYAYDCSGNPPKAQGASYGTQLAYNAEPDWGNWEDNYADKFTIIGNTLQFDEVYVPTTDADPQINHVVLHHIGGGVYVGKDTTYYTVDGRLDYVHMDVNMYEIHIDESGNVVDYYSEEHEYYQYIGG